MPKSSIPPARFATRNKVYFVCGDGMKTNDGVCCSSVKMRRFFIVAAGLLVLETETVSAHEHWIDADDFYPAAGETGKVFICSGHSFPKSNMTLKDRVLRSAEIIKPDARKTPLKTIEDGGQRSGEVVFETNGVHIITFELKQPQMKEAMHWAKSIIIADGNDDDARYSVGQGLEIVPGIRISTLRKGDKAPLIVRYNGEQVKARVMILPERGNSVSLSTTEQRPASLSLSHDGRYLVSANYKGKSCSLTFVVRQSGDEDD